MELDEKEKYEYLFSLADADKDGVIGLQDANFFARSGLQRPALGRVRSNIGAVVAGQAAFFEDFQIIKLQWPTNQRINFTNMKLIIKNAREYNIFNYRH